MAVAGTGGGSIAPLSTLIVVNLTGLGVESPLGMSSGSGVVTLADSGVERVDEVEAVSDDAEKLIVQCELAISNSTAGSVDKLA